MTLEAGHVRQVGLPEQPAPSFPCCRLDQTARRCCRRYQPAARPGTSPKLAIRVPLSFWTSASVSAHLMYPAGQSTESKEPELTVRLFPVGSVLAISCPAATAAQNRRIGAASWAGRWRGTGPRDHEASAAGLDPAIVESAPNDHKSYYPSSHRVISLVADDRTIGRLLGMQLFGHRHAEIANRLAITAAIRHVMTVNTGSDLDLSYRVRLTSTRSFAT